MGNWAIERQKKNKKKEKELEIKGKENKKYLFSQSNTSKVMIFRQENKKIISQLKYDWSSMPHPSGSLSSRAMCCDPNNMEIEDLKYVDIDELKYFSVSSKRTT
ncbi:hypothetical protein ACJX0J_026728 [Zea mays]